MRNSKLLLFILWLTQAIGRIGVAAPATSDYFTIQVVDEQTDRGVPLAELRTVNEVAWWTDSNGIIAFNEPGLMDIDVFFHVSSPGYEYPQDMFENRGLKLRTTRGGSATIKLKRLNIAERLYRITGQGIYRDSVLVGHPVPLKQPLINGQVVGQDTVIATPYRGKIYWFWGDTDRASNPLGNFGASGATSEPPGCGGLDPGVGVDLAYFVDGSGFSKPMCPLPNGGIRWIESLFTVPDERGRERLVARMATMSGLDEATNWYLLVFNDEKEVFEPIQRWDLTRGHESAHPFRARVDGTNYFYIFSDFRVPADLRSLTELKSYETFTCLAGDGKWRGPASKVDRDDAGRIRYTWKAGADRLRDEPVDELVKVGRIKSDEVGASVMDFETGASLGRGPDTVAWNEYRQRWIAFFADRPGGVIFAEADTLTGPWGYGRRIATHDEYNFYNIAYHPFFDQEAGRLVYFEGTYTASFSGAREKTPRYDYNQIMYRLALDDPRLTLPVAIYRVRGTNGSQHLWLRDAVEAGRAWEQIENVAWFALPPTSDGSDLVPVYASEKNGTALSLTPPVPNCRPLFLGLPFISSRPEFALQGCWQCRAVTAGGDELKFRLQLSLHGESVRGVAGDSNLTGSGTFRERKLTLTLKNENGTFILQGDLDNANLTGSWRKEDDSLQGTWSAVPVDTTPAEWQSPALVSLREYRRLADGGSDYSVQSEPPAGCEPVGRELCRVWKAPSTMLAVDWKAKPIPTALK